MVSSFLALPAPKKTKSGYSTDAETLEKLRPYHPIIDAILEYRHIAKLKSTYADGLLKVADENGIVRTTFLIDGEGRVERIMPRVKPDQNPAEILEIWE